MSSTLQLPPVNRSANCRESGLDFIIVPCESHTHNLWSSEKNEPPEVRLPVYTLDKNGRVRPEYRGVDLEYGAYVNQDGVVHCSRRCWVDACEED